MKIKQFQKIVINHYKVSGRHAMPWRQTTTSYNIVVSEVMLQQTQVSRVEPKFLAFKASFPDWQTLAAAPQAEVIKHWQGLGYNRRAISLHQTAKIVCSQYNGQLPKDIDLLCSLPGIGIATAGAIAAYAFDQPVAFIETNIRRACIHHFFAGKEDIADNMIVPILQDCIDRLPKDLSPRTWYWALTDYGAYLKTIITNPNKRSRHYAKQSVFRGSNREVRGLILKELTRHNSLSQAKLRGLDLTKEQRKILPEIVSALVQEGFVVQKNGELKLV